MKRDRRAAMRSLVSIRITFRVPVFLYELAFVVCGRSSDPVYGISRLWATGVLLMIKAVSVSRVGAEIVAAGRW